MNEGWAAYHHSKIMTTRALKDSEIIEYADHHSGTVAPHPGRLNPYKLGMELFRNIEDRWNKGKFGLEYENCDDRVEKQNWDKKLGLGREKIFEVRKLHNDLTFLDAFMDREFCEDQKLFSFIQNSASNAYEIADREFKKVKAKLLQNMTNMGSPQISVVDANTNNRRELTLKHQHDGVDLRLDWAWEVLKNLNRVWRRPTHLETIIEGSPKVLTFDGKDQKEEKISG
jgi:stage V sporulation protein R